MSTGVSSSPALYEATSSRGEVFQRPMLLGMNNPRSLSPEHALYPAPRGCAGHRLFEMLRAVEPTATMTGYRDRFERLNLVVGPWDRNTARRCADELRPTLAGRSVVLLGREVARAFGLRGEDVDEWAGSDGATFYLLPHPSGRNLRYNDPEVRRWAGRVLASLYRGE